MENLSIQSRFGDNEVIFHFVHLLNNIILGLYVCIFFSELKKLSEHLPRVVIAHSPDGVIINY